MADPLDCALDLLRRLPPSKVTKNVSKICSLVPAIQEELLSSVDQPLIIQTCAVTGKEVIFEVSYKVSSL